MFERETRREKILEGRIREIKLKLKAEAKAEAAAEEMQGPLPPQQPPVNFKKHLPLKIWYFNCITSSLGWPKFCFHIPIIVSYLFCYLFTKILNST